MNPILNPFSIDKEKLRQIIEKISPVFNEDVLNVSESMYEEFGIDKDLTYILLYTFLIHLLTVKKIIIKHEEKPNGAF